LLTVAEFQQKYNPDLLTVAESPNRRNARRAPCTCENNDIRRARVRADQVYRTFQDTYGLFHIEKTYRWSHVGLVGNYVTSRCGTRCAILAPPNNTTNATQKTALPTMTLCRRFHKLPPLHSPTHWLHFSRKSPWRQFLYCKVGECGQNEGTPDVFPVLARNREAGTIPRQVVVGWDYFSSHQGPIPVTGGSWIQ
jgi:hypothetical protein